MGLLKDILSIFKKHEISLKEKYSEVGDIYTLSLKRKNNLIGKLSAWDIYNKSCKG